MWYLSRAKNLLLAAILILSGLFANSAKALYVPTIKDLNITEDFIGKWEMKTIVTESNCPYVIVGSTTESNLIIKKGFENITALWSGGNWSNSEVEVKALTEKEAIAQRETILKGNDNNNWKAFLLDHLFIEDDQNMHSESIVKQYKNGKFVGEYKTYSVLSKVE